MTPQSTQAKTPPAATGLFALLGALLRAEGTSAPATRSLKIGMGRPITRGGDARDAHCQHLQLRPAGVHRRPGRPRLTPARTRGRQVLQLLTGMVCVCVFSGTVLGNSVALAAVPSPSLHVEGVTATSATFDGTLTPGEVGASYDFNYGKENVVCPSEKHAPEGSEGVSVGEETLPGEPVTGLTPGSEYLVCLHVWNAAHTEEMESSAVRFTTAIHPETPTGLKAEANTVTTATLKGVLNPGATGNTGTYEFVYRPSGASPTECQGEGEAFSAPETATGAKGEPVETKLSGLSPSAQYTVCLRAHNAAGEESALSATATFTTPAVSPVLIESESYSGLHSTEARLEAEINPGNSETTYHFEYGTEAGVYDVSVPAAGAKIHAGVAATSVSAVALGLEPGKTYHYRVVASNALPGVVDGADQTFTTPAAQGLGSPENCPNETRRTEQPFGLKLPDCRAYEMVSPVVTGGQDATSVSTDWGPRAAVSGEAVTYTSRGFFAEPGGGTVENQLLSRRNAEKGRWETQSISPLHEPFKTEIQSPFEGDAFTPELTAGIANTNAPLVEGAPGGKSPGEFGLYVANFGAETYRYAGLGTLAFGVSSDLSRVMLEKAEWVNGSIVPVLVSNEGEQIDGSVGAEPPADGFFREKDLWQAVSSDGSRVYFTSPSSQEEPGAAQLYVRENVGQPQSPLAKPEASGAGTLTAGSDLVSSLVSAAGVTPNKEIFAGTTELEVGPTAGRFVVGQPVAGPGIAPGTTIAAVSVTPESHALRTVLTLSTPTTEKLGGRSPISSVGPAPFEVGERIAGAGIAPGTTVTGASKGGELTLSAPAVSSGSGVALSAGGECTDPADACTVEVSASQRTGGGGPQSTSIDPNGAARYWGASADGSKVFFTSHQALTNDADTGASDQQEITVLGGGGTYTLTFKGQTTAPISGAANAEEVQSALEALSSIGDNVTVSEIGPGGFVSSDVRVTFKEALAVSEQPALIANGSSLTGTGSVTVTVSPAPGNDIYEYDLSSGKLTDLSADTEPADLDGAAVQGVVQISEDGSYVYFVAKGALAAGAKAQQCRKETAAEEKGEEPKQTNLGCNLYVSHEGRASFIATLAANDINDWESGELTPADEAGPEVNTAVVSPGGAQLAFVSAASLAGYDNHDAHTGQPDDEIYLYDAETGGLVCASCDPTGARPLGPSSLGKKQQSVGLYRARNLLEDGTLFFDSSDALVPHASDGRQNVYEYKDGRTYAISNVAGGGESFFMDASASGNDVFFASADRLLPEDTSSNLVVYNARVDGGFPVTTAAPPCITAEACRTASAPPPAVFGAPPSATFSGPGNLAPPPTVVKKVTKKAAKCKKGDVKKKVKKKEECIKKPKKKSKAKKNSHGKGRA